MDIIVPVHAGIWQVMLEAGDPPGRAEAGREHVLRLLAEPRTVAGDRLYVAHRSVVRFWVPILRTERVYAYGKWRTEIVWRDSGEASTPYCMTADDCECVYRWNGPHPRRVEVKAFLYRTWERAEEWRFPGWRTFAGYSRE